MISPDYKINNGVSFDELRMSKVQTALLQNEVDHFINTFTSRQHEAPSIYPEPEIELITDWLTSLPTQDPVNSKHELRAIFKTLQTALESGVETSAGTQLSFIPGSALPSSAMGRYLAAITNRWTGASFSCPGAIALEQSVISWMTNLFGYDQDAGGVLLSGGSMANFTATVAARCNLGDDFHSGTVYVSNNAHHSIAKACRLAGIAAKQIRTIPTDDNYRTDVTRLEQAIQNDVDQGYQPMMIVASAGTTDTGAIDPLISCAVLAQRYRAWLHVDAAYGGFFMLTPKGKDRLQGIALADSITVDAHKSLFMPFGVGALLVRDRKKLIQTNTESGSYLPDIDQENALPDFSALGPELSRPYRGLDMWLPLKLHGVGAFSSELQRMLSLAKSAWNQLNEIDSIDVLNSPDLSVVCFSCASGNAETQALIEFINGSTSVHVSSTQLHEKLAIRIAFLNYQTKDSLLDTLISLVKRFTANQQTKTVAKLKLGSESSDEKAKNKKRLTRTKKTASQCINSDQTVLTSSDVPSQNYG